MSQLNGHEIGRAGESWACARLRAKGYRILAQNWRSRYGELDIVAQTGQTIVFIEVKTRRNLGSGRPEDSVTPAKVKRLTVLAQAYLADHDLDLDWRIDVVAIEADRAGRVKRYEHIENAVRGW